MADRRMFSKTIILSDAFLDMPASTRCLYFTLSMLADDDGFINSPKSIMRLCGATDDDMKILSAKSFVIPFDTGVVVIRHWRLNNYLRGDRYKPTVCQEEMAQIAIGQNGEYSICAKIQTPKKNRVPLTEREPKNEIEQVEKIYLANYETLYKAGRLRTEKPVINWTQSRKLTKDCIEKYGLSVILDAVRNSSSHQFCIEKGYALTTILSAGVLAQLVNGHKGIGGDEVQNMEVDF